MTEEWTWLNASGQVMGPMLRTVSLLPPSRSWSHTVVAASGTHRKSVLTLMPKPGSQATILRSVFHCQNLVEHPGAWPDQGVTSGIQDVHVPDVNSGGR